MPKSTVRAKVNPVQPADADKLAAYMLKWQQRLNLGDWRLVRSNSPARGAMAEITKRDLEQRLAVYRVGADFGATPVTDRSLEEVAIHEMLHVFLTILIESAKDPNIRPADLEGLEHGVINVLEQLLIQGELR